jgi:hypothetical protein
MKSYILLVLLFSFFFNLNAQINTAEKRIEIDLKDGFFNEKIHELDSAGFLITSAKGKPNKPVHFIRFQYYSNDLELLDEQLFEIPSGYSLTTEFRKGKRFSQLYTSGTSKFFVLNYDVSSKKIVKISGKTDKKIHAFFGMFIIPYFETTEDYAYFTLHTWRRKFLFAFDLKTKKVQVTPIAIKGIRKMKLIPETPRLDTSILYVPVMHFKPRKKPTTYLMEFDVKGELLTTTPLDKNVRLPFFNTAITPLPNKDILMSGITGRDARFGSTGMYITTSVNETIQNINYYDYADLPNFNDFKPGKTFRRITLIQWIYSKFGHDVRYYYQMTAPQIIPCGENYIFISEFYVPTFGMAATIRVQKGKRKTTIRRVFNGNLYTHALVAKITKKGEMIWSQCIEMNPETKPYFPKQFLNILEQNEDYVRLFYADVEKIHELQLDFDGQLLSDQVVGKIDGLLADDQVKLSYADIDYWYDQHFISYGAQRIKNTKDKSVKRRRTVIYVNKIGVVK